MGAAIVLFLLIFNAIVSGIADQGAGASRRRSRRR